MVTETVTNIMLRKLRAPTEIATDDVAQGSGRWLTVKHRPMEFGTKTKRFLFAESNASTICSLQGLREAYSSCLPSFQ